ncbi:MAG: hypothetical protein L0I76_35310, partial [Pseudonocardia sp.]|nr:hypothetical protein [Pseudonocardia sp.]
WLLAAVAASLNLWHGATGPGGLQVGVAYALASLVGFALVELLVGHQRRARASADRTRRPRGLLIGLARLLRYPLLSWAAWSRRVELGPGADAGEAWGQAWRDRFGVELGADAIARRRGRAGMRAARRTAGAAPGAGAASSGHGVVPSDGQGDQGSAPDTGGVEDDGSRPGTGERCGGDRCPPRELPDTGGDDEAAESGAEPSGSGDARVEELAELVVAGCPVTGEQAGAMYAVSSRTGRRLLARAQTLLSESGRDPEPPDGPGSGAAAQQPKPLALVAAPAELGVGA